MVWKPRISTGRIFAVKVLRIFLIKRQVSECQSCSRCCGGETVLPPGKRVLGTKAYHDFMEMTWSAYWELNSKTSEWKSGGFGSPEDGFRLLVCLPRSGRALLTLSWGISVHIRQSERQPCSSGYKPNVPQVAMRFRRHHSDNGPVSPDTL